MEGIDAIVNNGVLATGGTGVIIIIIMFIRQLVSNTSKTTIKNDAEVDILNVWREERNNLKKLTDTLQQERFELMFKLSTLQIQLQAVQDQLSLLLKDKQELMELVREKEEKCKDCEYCNSVG